MSSRILYKLVIYGSWVNRRGKSVGRSYRTTVMAKNYNEACALACKKVGDKYKCNADVLYGW